MPLSVGGGAGWPGPRPTSVPSGILIHPTVWPQYTTTSQTDRSGQTDNDPIGYRAKRFTNGAQMPVVMYFLISIRYVAAVSSVVE